MNMRAPVSVCIIVRDDPFIEKCVHSVRDFVEEIVIVDTGSLPENQALGRKCADIFEVFTACNDPQSGMIEDFSMARNRSFELATKPWIMWQDSDDLIVGAENLTRIISEYDTNRTDIEAISYLFPYEYSYNDQGCNCRHYRERLFYNKSKFHWVNPVHEVCIPNEGARVSLIQREELTFKHQRQYNPKIVEPGRNLRILSKYFEKVGESDARQMYYLGLELTNVGRLEEAIKMLSRYIELSGWDDERAMAALKLVDIYMAMNKPEEGVKWAFKTIEIKENWCEGYFALCKMFYFLACKGGPQEQKYYEKIVYFAKIGFSLPPTQTLLFINPQDRAYEIHRYYNIALNKLGDVKGAAESAAAGIKAQPNDTNLVYNKKLYDIHLAKQQLVPLLNTLKETGELTEFSYGILNSIFNKNIDPEKFFGSIMTPEKQFERTPDGRPVANMSSDKEGWGIPQAYAYDSLPIKMTKEQLQAVVIMVWQQFMSNNEILSAKLFLENAPLEVRHTFSTEKILAITKEKLVSQTDTKSNLIFGKYLATLPYPEKLQKVSHLFAHTQWSIVEYFKKEGFGIKDCYNIDDKIYIEVYENTITNTNKLDIVFCIGDGMEVWTPETFKKTGLGGSETMAVENAKRLAALGNRVRVYEGCGDRGDGIYDGVEYYQTEKYKDLTCDILIVSRNAAMLADSYNINAKVKLLWVHDVYAINATNELLLKADRILALTEWHKQNIINAHNVHPDQVLVTRNGIDLKRFEKDVPRNKFKAVNSSSPDRSWPILFECWPHIRARVPQAELHLYYGFLNWEKVAVGRPGQPELIARLKQQIAELAPLGVVYHDRVSQAQLAEEFLSAGVWTFPTWFTETSCMTAMEAQAAGLRTVTSAIAALNETVGSRGMLLGGTWTDPTYKQLFVDHVVDAMQKEDNGDRIAVQEYAKEHFCLDKLAKEWQAIFHNLIETKKSNPISPYYPTIPYRGPGAGYYNGDTRLADNDPNRNKHIVEEKKVETISQPIIKSAQSNTKISVIVPTNRVGGMDILFESLKAQSFQDFELVLVDSLFHKRQKVVAEKAREYNFTIKHIAPQNNIFPVANYCQAINSGLCVASGEIAYFTSDYSYMHKDILFTHNSFHSQTPNNYILMLPINDCTMKNEAVSHNFPKDRQYGMKDKIKEVSLMNVPEAVYTNAHNEWTDRYFQDLNNGLLDNVLWSIFETPFIYNNGIGNITSSMRVDTKFSDCAPDRPKAVLHDLCCMKNDSFKLDFLLKANGLDEEMDGTYGYQNTELARRLYRVYDAQFFAMNTMPAFTIDTNYYLTPRKILKGYNNNKIIIKKYMKEESLAHSIITEWKKNRKNV